MKKAIITGITGQDGAYLAKLLIEKNYQVLGLTRDDLFFQDNLKYLNILDNIELSSCNLLDLSHIIKLISKFQPDEIYNLASQSSVSKSFNQPVTTLEFNIISVTNLLEAIRLVNPEIRFYQASSSEMYGASPQLPITEKSIMHPLSPYAISKASAHWITVNYRESYGLFTCSGILFNHESFLRREGFFIKKIIQTAINISIGKQNTLEVGNIDIKRDFGYAPDYVEAMYLMMQQKIPDDYVIASGESYTLRDLIYYIFDKLHIDHAKCQVVPHLFRPNEIQNLYGTSQKAKETLGWIYNQSFYDVIDLLLTEELSATIE